MLNVVWNVDDMVNLDFDSMTLPGHTALDRTDSHQDLVIASFVDLRGTYTCTVVNYAILTNSPRLSPGPVEGNHWYHTIQEIFHECKAMQCPHCALMNLLSIDESTVRMCISAAAEVTISNLTLASRTATTLSVTWSAGYPKCYSFTVSHSTQDGSITVTQPADNDTSHTLTSLQPGTTYRIEVGAVRKGDGADGQGAKVVGNFTTDDAGKESLN